MTPLAVALSTLAAAAIPGGYWTPEQAEAVLAGTEEIRLAPDLTTLTPGERKALGRLLEVGRLFQALYEQARHHQARQALAALESPSRPPHAAALLRVYRLNQGPIATTLDNLREAFVPVDPTVPGKNVYPWGLTREEIDRFLAAHPGERDKILDPRTAVRRATADNLRRDLADLTGHPALETLHPGLRARLSAQADPSAFYAVPYAVAYADEMLKAYGLLLQAAEDVRTDDPELAGYLRNRARDLLSNDYESGDAAWVTGRFGRLNAEIGAYEAYDDELFGTKAFFAVSLLLRDEKATAELREALKGLQEIENALPYGRTTAGGPGGTTAAHPPASKRSARTSRWASTR